MSHFAELDANNKVIRVLVGDNNEPDEGKAFMESLGGTWVKTSYNATFRKNYAGVGYFYDENRDAFIEPKPFNSWILNEETCKWEAPTPYPSGDGIYQWIENDLNWQLVEGV